MNSVVESLVSAGPLGAIVIALGVAYWRQTKSFQEDLKAVHDARVAEAQAVTETLLELTDKWHVAINELSLAVREMKVSYRPNGKGRRHD